MLSEAVRPPSFQGGNKLQQATTLQPVTQSSAIELHEQNTAAANVSNLNVPDCAAVSLQTQEHNALDGMLPNS